MPHYDYACSNCGHVEEIFQKIVDAALSQCPACHQFNFSRGPGGGIGLQFQGEGFYINDYDSEKSPLPKKTDATLSKGCACGKSACDA